MTRYFILLAKIRALSLFFSSFFYVGQVHVKGNKTNENNKEKAYWDSNIIKGGSQKFTRYASWKFPHWKEGKTEFYILYVRSEPSEHKRKKKEKRGPLW